MMMPIRAVIALILVLVVADVVIAGCAFSDCTTCVADPSCGWCNNGIESGCYAGTASGGPNAPGACTVAQFSVGFCPAGTTCQGSTCSQCLASMEFMQCGWCENSGTCQQGGTVSGGPSNHACGYPNYFMSSCPATNNCASYGACGSCVADSQCGWCSSGNICIPGSLFFPTEPSMCSNYSSWQYGSCGGSPPPPFPPIGSTPTWLLVGSCAAGGLAVIFALSVLACRRRASHSEGVCTPARQTEAAMGILLLICATIVFGIYLNMYISLINAFAPTPGVTITMPTFLILIIVGWAAVALGMLFMYPLLQSRMRTAPSAPGLSSVVALLGACTTACFAAALGLLMNSPFTLVFELSTPANFSARMWALLIAHWLSLVFGAVWTVLVLANMNSGARKDSSAMGIPFMALAGSVNQ